ncbi:RlpA-like double-psi beta-barrel-protein domain-containing protein-containing protein [Circinella umbellata]|nr:RlpA-like double-psi beta-barrel-protein domain-containing protein-containing protein [Circinella umbellata]
MRFIISLITLTVVQAWMIFATAKEEHVGRGTAGLMLHHQPLTNTNGLSKRRSRGTWYHGKDLKNAACYGQNGLPSWDATDHDMIGAMAMEGHEKCGECYQITNNDHPDLSIPVMIIDKCAACTLENWIDLTPGAFKLLSRGGDLNIGVLNISWESVSCSKVKGRLPPKKD